MLAFDHFLNGARKQWLACACNVHLSYAWLRGQECMGAEALQMLRLRTSVQHNLHGMHACSKHVETNPGDTLRATQSCGICMLVACIALRGPACKHLLDMHKLTMKNSTYQASIAMHMFHPSHSKPAKTKLRKTVHPGSMHGLAPHALEQHADWHLFAWFCWCSLQLCSP